MKPHEVIIIPFFQDTTFSANVAENVSDCFNGKIKSTFLYFHFKIESNKDIRVLKISNRLQSKRSRFTIFYSAVSQPQGI
jgi:hypothetical protein